MTKIEWTNFLPGYKGESWNPIVGCEKISTGCDNCYAEAFAFRLTNMLGSVGNGDNIDKWAAYSDVINNKKWNGKTSFIPSILETPISWKKPRVIFVCSMGDIFHETVKDIWLYRIFKTISQTPQHKYIILTKRPERMRHFICFLGNQYILNALRPNEKPLFDIWPIHNLWIGVTAENQEAANKRIAILLTTPASVRFISVEPMLGEINLNLELTANKLIHWVICGGETGHNARYLNPNWVKNLQTQCKKENLPFFFKKWGGKTKSRQLNGLTYNEYPINY